MRALVWLLLSGLLWLGLVQLAPHFGIPSQIISLARSGYIALFSIFMMVELRGASYSAKHRPTHLYLYLLPLLSLFILSLFSSDFILTGLLLTNIISFYICAFALINIRSELGHIRSARWDLAAPPLFLVLMIHPAVTAVGGLLGLGYILMLVRRPVDEENTTHLDAIIVQLPSICIAPVVLIALRDVFDGGGLIDRTHVESFGLVVNGVGAAVWTAIVLRGVLPLERLGVALWAMSFAGAAILAFLPTGPASSAMAIVVAEGFRGAIWLATTIALARLPRGKGLAANLVATMLPLAALWLCKDRLVPSATLLVYAGFVLPIPLVAWFIVRQYSSRSAQRATG